MKREEKHVKKKTIAIVCQSVGLVERGGESFITEFVLNMKKYYDIDVYCGGIEEEIEENITVVGCAKGKFLNLYEKTYKKSKLLQYILNRTRYTHFILPHSLFLRKFNKIVYNKFLKEKTYDLLFPQNGVWSVIYAKKIRSSMGTPFIYVGHGGIGPGEYWILKFRPNMYICITQKQYNWAIKYFADITTISHGVNLKRFSECKNEKSICKKKTILTVGALTEDYKRHSLTIKALTLLPDVNLIILGMGSDEKDYMEMLEKKIPGRYQLTWAKHSEIWQYYKMADVFVLPSIDEAFGIVYIEALAANVPIVAPDDEVRRAIIGDAGLYCNVTDIKEYAETIKKCMEIDWGDIPKKRASLFGWENVSIKYNNLIECLISKQ